VGRAGSAAAVARLVCIHCWWSVADGGKGRGRTREAAAEEEEALGPRRALAWRRGAKTEHAP